MKPKDVEPNAAEVLRQIAVVRNDVETAVALSGMLRALSDDAMTEALNGQPDTLVRCAALVQDSILVSAFAAISRAHDHGRDARPHCRTSSAALVMLRFGKP